MFPFLPFISHFGSEENLNHRNLHVRLDHRDRESANGLEFAGLRVHVHLRCRLDEDLRAVVQELRVLHLVDEGDGQVAHRVVEEVDVEPAGLLVPGERRAMRREAERREIRREMRRDAARREMRREAERREIRREMRRDAAVRDMRRDAARREMRREEMRRDMRRRGY